MSSRVLGINKAATNLKFFFVIVGTKYMDVHFLNALVVNTFLKIVHERAFSTSLNLCFATRQVCRDKKATHPSTVLYILVGTIYYIIANTCYDREFYFFEGKF